VALEKVPLNNPAAENSTCDFFFGLSAYDSFIFERKKVCLKNNKYSIMSAKSLLFILMTSQMTTLDDDPR
jgi:hypothetical protein